MPAKKKSQNYYEISFIQINDNKNITKNNILTNLRVFSLHWQFLSPSINISAPSSCLL